MEDFLVRALVAGLGVAVIAGPLGCFVVWRRMAYFGATLAHSALLGVALGLLLGVNPTLGIAGSAIAVALLVVLFERRRRLIAADTLLGLLAHASLAIGLVALSFLQGVRVDLMSYLFGDVLAVAPGDLAWIYGGGLLALGTLMVIWRPLLAITLHEEMARAEGVPVAAVQAAFMLTIAVVIAIAMKVVGILLIVSLLIIPAAAARRFARTPEQMAVLAALVGALAVAGGLFGSLAWDTPAGPSIVVAATVLFALSLALGAAFAKRAL
ncbi:MAG: iron chelate uptake ABC transporter family permease subunit [Kiloniellaceae bacterium]